MNLWGILVGLIGLACLLAPWAHQAATKRRSARASAHIARVRPDADF